MSSDHPLVSCTCAVCHTWRRVGLLLVRPEATVPFREYALRRVRELFTELLDASDGLVLGVGGPLAGGPPVLPVGVPAASVQTPAQGPGGVAPGLTPGQAATGPATAIGPAQATSKVPPASPPPFLGVPGIPPETETPVKEEIASPVEVKTSPEKKKNQRRTKKPRTRRPNQCRPPPLRPLTPHLTTPVAQRELVVTKETRVLLPLLGGSRKSCQRALLGRGHRQGGVNGVEGVAPREGQPVDVGDINPVRRDARGRKTPVALG